MRQLELHLEDRIITKKNGKIISFNRSTGRPFIRSKECFKVFEEKSMLLLKSQAAGEKFLGRVYIDYVFFVKGAQIVDTDNMQTTINDLLQDAGIITNDRNNVEGHYKRIDNAGKWGAIITVIEGWEQDI